MKLHGRSSVLDGSEGRDPSLVLERQNEDGRRAYLIRNLLNRDELYAQNPDKDVDARLHRALPRATHHLRGRQRGLLYLCLRP